MIFNLHSNNAHLSPHGIEEMHTAMENKDFIHAMLKSAIVIIMTTGVTYGAMTAFPFRSILVNRRFVSGVCVARSLV
jgi:hypothetical protein